MRCGVCGMWCVGMCGCVLLAGCRMWRVWSVCSGGSGRECGVGVAEGDISVRVKIPIDVTGNEGRFVSNL